MAIVTMTTATLAKNSSYYQRLQQRQASPWPELWGLLDQVKDPEIPVLSIWDLGILQEVKKKDELVTVVITPTYTACPAMRQIATDIQTHLQQAGYSEVCVESQLSPPWTTDWISPMGCEKLRQYGIAPPIAQQTQIPCPYCDSKDVSKINDFGSTACKALFRCNHCLEPFEHFKCL